MAELRPKITEAPPQAIGETTEVDVLVTADDINATGGRQGHDGVELKEADVNREPNPTVTPAASTPPNVSHPKKTKKARKERKHAAQQESEDAQSTSTMTASKDHAAGSTADTLLFQRLGVDMANGLMKAGHVDAPTKSLDLVNRLSSATRSSTTTTNVTTTTTKTTTTELSVIMEKETDTLRRGNCTRRSLATATLDCCNSSDSDDSGASINNEKTTPSHISSQASKLSHLLPPYQISSYTARQANLISASRRSLNTFTLSDFAAIAALESLAERYGRVSHMGMLDPSYTFFITQARTAALYFKGMELWVSS